MLAIEALETSAPRPYAEFRPQVSSSAERARTEMQALVETNDEQAIRSELAKCDAIDPVILYFVKAIENQVRQSQQR